MNILMGDIWEHRLFGYIVVPTNGVVTRSGEAVMGRGLALQTKQRYPEFPRVLARHLLNNGNVIGIFHEYSIITFPVKHHWQDKADLILIRESAQALGAFMREQTDNPACLSVYAPKVGCGNGQRNWHEVSPILEEHCPYVTIIDRSI